MWEKAPLEMVAEAGELMAYKHSGFWHPKDKLRDQKNLETLYQNGKPYWISKEEGCVSILEK